MAESVIGVIHSRLRFYYERYRYEFLMWVYSISPPNLSLIGPLTKEIYYIGPELLETQTNTHKQKRTHS